MDLYHLVHVTAHVWMSEDNLGKSLLSFHHAHHRDQVQVICGAGDPSVYVLLSLVNE